MRERPGALSLRCCAVLTREFVATRCADSLWCFERQLGVEDARFQLSLWKVLAAMIGGDPGYVLTLDDDGGSSGSNGFVGGDSPTWFGGAELSGTLGGKIDTHFGIYIIATLASLCGLIFTAMLVAVIERSLRFTMSETAVQRFINEASLSSTVTHAAANAIQNAYRRHKFSNKLKSKEIRILGVSARIRVSATRPRAACAARHAVSLALATNQH